MGGFESLDEDDDWDQDFADELIGQTLLLGLTYFEHDGTLIRRQQIFGVVESCDRRDGIVIRQKKSGELFIAAPVLDAIEHAGPGIYQLKDDDEEVKDPDFTAMFRVTSPSRL